MNGLVLLCYLIIKVGNSKALEQVWILNAFEKATSSVDEQPQSPFSCFAEAHPIDSRWILNAFERATSSVDEQPKSPFSCFAEAHPKCCRDIC